MKNNFLRKIKGFQIAAFAIFSFSMFILGSIVAMSYLPSSQSDSTDANCMESMRQTALIEEKDREINNS